MFKMWKFLLLLIPLAALLSSSIDNTQASLQPSEAIQHEGSSNAEQQEVSFRDGGGQLELFSSHATGLGDLEAQDELKKMNKRNNKRSNVNLNQRKSAEGSEHGSGQTNKIGPIKRSSPSVMQSAGRLLSNQLQDDEPMSLLGVPGDKYGAILVGRRTGESGLVDPRILEYQGQLFDDNQPQQQEEFVEPELGEYDSRVSLLTTRKMQPQPPEQTYGDFLLQLESPQVDRHLERQHLLYNILKQLVPNQKMPVNSRKQSELSGSVSRVLLSQPKVHGIQMILDRDSSLDDIETQSAMSHLVDSNYLPRIARSAYMRRRRRR